MKRVAVLLLALFLLVPIIGCGQAQTETQPPDTTSAGENSVAPEEKTVGISMPNGTDERWIRDGELLSAGLKAMDCRVILEYAQDDPLLQAEQIDDMIAQKVDCLVVTAVDAFMLTDVLQKAKNAKIPVIAYDRLVMNTDAIVCYVGFDNTTAGIQIGRYIADGKKLETAAAEGRSHTIELFMGAPEDHNALTLHQGIMQVLKPYFDSGVLVSRTGRIAFEDVCTRDWSAETAKSDCGQYLAEYYIDDLPDILCTASDSLAQGCREALEEADGVPGENWPLITGQDASAEAVRRILSGHQTMTAYKDYGALLQDCLKAAEAVLTLAPLQNGDASCYNGVKFFPAFLTRPVTVDAQNYKSVLIDSGILKPEDVEQA
jgi:putative multiple sugar transport system substrate-binding protein